MEIDKATILIADDSSADLQLMTALLQERYHLRVASGASAALHMLHQAPRPDLILVAAALPDSQAATLCQDVKSSFLCADIPVIFLIAGGDGEEEGRALHEGAADCVSKPINAAILQARVSTHVRLKAALALLEDQHSHLEHLVAERTGEVVRMQDATIVAMASLVETRDNDTGNHIRRTQHYLAALARELRFHARFSAELSDANIALLSKAAPLHDIGKIGVPDAILLKPGRLSEEEFEIMKLHTVYGRDAIMGGMEKSLGGSTPFLRYACEIAYSHQEKWDGSGYPEGLKGEAIPLSARLMAVADVYDALVSKRVYKPAFTHETAVELIRRGRGKHFDPDVVDAMLVIEEKFKAIAAELRDPEPAAPAPMRHL